MRQLSLDRVYKIGFFFFLVLIISLSLMWLFEKKFDATLWKAEPTQRHEMVDDLLESQLLMNKSKDEVILFLGNPKSSISQGKDIFLYRLGTPPSFFEEQREQLMVVFENGKVTNVTIAID